MTMTGLKSAIFITSAILSGAMTLSAQEQNSIGTDSSRSIIADNNIVASEQSGTSATTVPDTPFSRHFTWGASLGSSIDMTGQDMTAVDIDAFFGYKGNYIRFAGLGTGIRMMVSNSSRSYPVYAMLRTSFTKSPSFLYLELKGGVGFTNLYTDIYQRNFVGGVTLGFTLAHSRTFSSNFSLGYEYMPLSNGKIDGNDTKFKDIHYASIRIGASF